MIERRQVLISVISAGLFSTAGCLMSGNQEWVLLEIQNEDSTTHIVQVAAKIETDTYQTEVTVQPRTSNTDNEFMPFSDNDYRAEFSISVDGSQIRNESVLISSRFSRYRVVVSSGSNAEIEKVGN